MMPTRWLTDHEHLLPSGAAGHDASALDVACGRGRNAIWLARRGLITRGIDRDPAVIHILNEEALRQRLPLRGDVVDLERDPVSLGSDLYDVVVVVHYLHRPLFPALLAAVRPGGLLVYETFTGAQAARGKPTNPAFLLEPGELRELLQPLQILVEREGEFEDKMLASVIARRALP
jgi:2-polyprenyl-3-methyl-5-hydroxy-6-metoxy-1,4-benzoquinol methylase